MHLVNRIVLVVTVAGIGHSGQVDGYAARYQGPGAPPALGAALGAASHTVVTCIRASLQWTPPLPPWWAAWGPRAGCELPRRGLTRGSGLRCCPCGTRRGCRNALPGRPSLGCGKWGAVFLLVAGETLTGLLLGGLGSRKGESILRLSTALPLDLVPGGRSPGWAQTVGRWCLLGIFSAGRN